MTSFVAAVIQSEQLGVSMAKVLRIQSDQMRIRRRQRAEEEAHKAPIKMLVPMALLIFPALMVALIVLLPRCGCSTQLWQECSKQIEPGEYPMKLAGHTRPAYFSIPFALVRVRFGSSRPPALVVTQPESGGVNLASKMLAGFQTLSALVVVSRKPAQACVMTAWPILLNMRQCDPTVCLTGFFARRCTGLDLKVIWGLANLFPNT